MFGNPSLREKTVGLTRQSIVEVLGEKFEEDTQYRHEFLYERTMGLVRVRVFSGIPRMSNFGEQTIRIRVVHGVSLKSMLQFIVPIDTRWRVTLCNRLEQIHEEVGGIRYCHCGGLLFRQRGRYGKFVACTNCEYRERVHSTVEVEETLISPSTVITEPKKICGHQKRLVTNK